MMLWADLAVAGLSVGSVAALAGIGLLVTYRTTGVLNLGFGAIAMLVAYLLWQAVRVWAIPVWIAAPVAVLGVAPGLGVLLDVVVFGPLQRRGASAVERLVASLGVFVLLVGTAFLVWGGQARTDAPQLLPVGEFRVDLPGGVLVVPQSTLAEVGIVLAVPAGLAGLMRATRFGLLVRAVVADRTLAELSMIDAPRVARAGWACGCMLAGLAGVLLAPALRLDPYGLTLVVLESMAVALAARLSSIRTAVLVALGLGVAQSELTQLHPGGVADALLRSVATNLLAVVLLVAALTIPAVREAGDDGDAGRAAVLSARRDLPSVPGWWMAYLVALAVPFWFDAADLRFAQRVPALAIIFVSLVLVTGYSGQICLGTTGFAGLGAVIAAALSGAGLLALGVAAVLVVPAGLLTGLPAMRRRGLLVMFMTFAVATVVSRFVLEQPWATQGLTATRPWPFTSDRSFYLLELLCLGLALVFVRNLHVGRIGRALLAVRDSEAGARAAGVDVGTLKVVTFGVSAGLAAVGGALLTMGGRAFDPSDFDPVQGLIWFAAVVVFGADSAAGAVLAAGLIVGMDAGLAPGAATVTIGVLAVLLGHTPGGVSGLRRFLPRIAEASPASHQPVRLTAYGRRLVAERRLMR